jgi:hypothetical protein
VEGVVPVAYGLFAFAFALATAAGVLLRRSIAALAVAMIVFVAVRFVVAGFLRPVFGSPSTAVEAAGAMGGGVYLGRDNRSDWVLDMTFQDAAGNPLDDAAWLKVVKAANDAGQPLSEYAAANGIQRLVTYHPGDRFWDFQLIEAGLFAGAAAMFVALVVWRVRRRGL